jgi:hypothetical protein
MNDEPVTLARQLSDHLVNHYGLTLLRPERWQR